MEEAEVRTVVDKVGALVGEHYPDVDAAEGICGALSDSLAKGTYPADPPALAAAVTRDLQSVNGDQHLRLLFHHDFLPERRPGDDSEELAAMLRWARQTCSGVAQVRRLAGNVGYLDLQPVIFPAAICAEDLTASLSLLAHTEALVLDLRGCLGGDPATVTHLVSYLWDTEPAQLTGLVRRGDQHTRQVWTHAYVPGHRFGRAKPVFVLTSAMTFSGGEQVAYDLQQLGRATLVGERTRGGAHARASFRVHPHLEATIPVARSVNPVSGTNWERVGVSPDVETTAGEAFVRAHRLALDHVIAQGGPAAAEACAALDGLTEDPGRGSHAPPPNPMGSDLAR